MSTLKSVYENPTLKESEAAYLEGWYLRLSAHLFFLYQNLDVEKRAHLLPFCSQDLSPLWLLETAYTKYCTALSTSTGRIERMTSAEIWRVASSCFLAHEMYGFKMSKSL